ncbi:MAG TPA: alpha/beta hydrolase-fold protein, partial [Gemmatimonadaceae bacterium]|nr:alpha/beta hydrolase-fold protein [Gemmatimonadaceae bacterium]
HRAIAGASMGGYGAVTLALKHPETWSVAGSHSGVLAPAGVTRETSRSWAAGLAQAYGGRWPYWSARFGVDSSTWAARDPCALARELAAHGTNHMPALRFDAGRSDPLAFQSRIFEYCLTALRVPHEYHESAGGHDWRYWRVHGAESLAWLSARVGSGR